jgi:hypothetical protein
MNRKRVVVIGAITAVLLFVVWLCWRRREALRDKVPAWLANHQPPETITPEMMTVTPIEAYAANRCRPFAASCLDFTAGRRVRRTYAESLESDPNSVVRARLSLEGGL